MKEYKLKGEEFEKFVGNNFKNKGYQVIFNGLEKGKKDQERKIKHTHLKEFLGNCTV